MGGAAEVMGPVCPLVFFQSERLYILHGGVPWERRMKQKVERRGLRWCGNTCHMEKDGCETGWKDKIKRLLQSILNNDILNQYRLIV